MLCAEPALLTSTALAREQTRSVDIPAGPLSSAIDRFSAATGISVGLPGDMPHVMTRQVTGNMLPDQILRKLLVGILGKRYYLYAHSNNNITPGSPTALKVGLNARF